MSYVPHSPLGLFGSLVETADEPAITRFGGAVSSYGAPRPPKPVTKPPPKKPEREKKRTVSLRDLKEQAEERGETGRPHEAHEKGELKLRSKAIADREAAAAAADAAAEQRKRYVLYGAVAVGGLAALWILRRKKGSATS